MQIRSADTKKRYVHIYYSASKAAGERARLEENIQEMQSYLARFQDTDHEFGPAFHKYFPMHYNKETGHLSQLISREKNPQLREALEDLDEFMNGYYLCANFFYAL